MRKSLYLIVIMALQFCNLNAQSYSWQDDNLKDEVIGYVEYHYNLENIATTKQPEVHDSLLVLVTFKKYYTDGTIHEEIYYNSSYDIDTIISYSHFKDDVSLSKHIYIDKKIDHTITKYIAKKNNIIRNKNIKYHQTGIEEFERSTHIYYGDEQRNYEIITELSGSDKKLRTTYRYDEESNTGEKTIYDKDGAISDIIIYVYCKQGCTKEVKHLDFEVAKIGENKSFIMSSGYKLVTTYKYNKKGFSTLHKHSNYADDFHYVYKIWYDKHNNIKKEHYTEKDKGSIGYGKYKYKYKYDHHNNWIEKYEYFHGELTDIYIRNYDYY